MLQKDLLMPDKIRVFIVDDSAIVREILSSRLSQHPRIDVVGSAMDPYIAREKLDKTEVDVITLDIEMPRMDGLTFLRQIMKHYPKPVIIVSSLAKEASPAALRALELGAVDAVPKPGGPFSVEDVVDLLTDRILAASIANVSRLKEGADKLVCLAEPAPQKAPQAQRVAGSAIGEALIAVGASTGGTIALETLFREWEPSFPPTLAVIHMPERFTAAFAARLNELSRATVVEASDGEPLMRGTIYIAPGNYHMMLGKRGAERIVKIASGPRICNQRPAVDPLFNSVAERNGAGSLGILLTGMGKDGAQGLLKIRQAGGRTIAQDELSSVVWGMPKAAIDLGAAETVLPLGEIVAQVRSWQKLVGYDR
jgi:two-component system chemotaxis response regulator CheB